MSLVNSSEKLPALNLTRGEAEEGLRAIASVVGALAKQDLATD